MADSERHGGKIIMDSNFANIIKLVILVFIGEMLALATGNQLFLYVPAGVAVSFCLVVLISGTY
jgi:hypothetical protein